MDAFLYCGMEARRLEPAALEDAALYDEDATAVDGPAPGDWYGVRFEDLIEYVLELCREVEGVLSLS